MFLVALPRSSKHSAFLLFFCDLSNTWQKFTRTKISEMKPVISICPCGVAIQYIAEKTRRVGSRSKTVTGNTHCIALWVYGLTPKMIRPSKTDCFLRAKISDLKKPLPKLDTISDPNSSLFSGAIARPQSPTSWRKKTDSSCLTRTGPWSYPKPEVDTVPGLGLLCQGQTGKNLSREQSWKRVLPFFPLFHRDMCI